MKEGGEGQTERGETEREREKRAEDAAAAAVAVVDRVLCGRICAAEH